MKVQATVGFVSTIDSKKYRVQAGQVLVMPEGADWVTAGLAVAVEAEAPKKGKK